MKRRILITASAVAILGGLIWLLIPAPEPAYAGKSLSNWLAAYDHQNLDWPRSFDTPADNAIRHIGTNAFPAITERLCYQDSALKVEVVRFNYSHLHRNFPALALGKYNRQAIAALCALGHDAKPLIPTLAENYGHLDVDARIAAGFWLESLGTDGEAAIPALIKVLNNTNNTIFRPFAVETLAAVGRDQTGLVLPLLEECLQDPDFNVRLQAANELSRQPWKKLKAMDRPGIGVLFFPEPNIEQ